MFSTSKLHFSIHTNFIFTTFITIIYILTEPSNRDHPQPFQQFVDSLAQPLTSFRVAKLQEIKKIRLRRSEEERKRRNRRCHLESSTNLVGSSSLVCFYYVRENIDYECRIHVDSDLVRSLSFRDDFTAAPFVRWWIAFGTNTTATRVGDWLCLDMVEVHVRPKRTSWVAFQCVKPFFAHDGIWIMRLERSNSCAAFECHRVGFGSASHRRVGIGILASWAYFLCFDLRFRTGRKRFWTRASIYGCIVHAFVAISLA